MMLVDDSLKNIFLKAFLITLSCMPGIVWSWNAPVVANKGMVVTASEIASNVGSDILKKGGNAMDAAIASAFALAVTHPTAGNIGGGGFLVYRNSDGKAFSYDFREVAPTAAAPDMWLEEGEYSFDKHHRGYLAVGVPGTVAGLHMAWKDHGSLPWRELLKPAIALARKGFRVSHNLAASLKAALPRFAAYPASLEQFSNRGKPLKPGEFLRQKDLAKTLTRIAKDGPDGFYKGKTAELMIKEMERGSGLITIEDLAIYKAKRRDPIKGLYRGYDIISMPPPSSGGVTLIQILNILEGFKIGEYGYGSAKYMHLAAEAMRRAFEDRARYLGDPDYNPSMPLETLVSKAYAADQRATIDQQVASVSRLPLSENEGESEETTHLSVVDEMRNAVSLTYTLEWGYGSGIVVSGAGFLLNNEMGDFNAIPGVTTDRGLIGTSPNLAQPGKRMLSSMTPTILAKDGKLVMVTGAPGGRTIINTVLQTIVNVVDFEMTAQSAVDASRFHHQWFPDRIITEKQGFSPDSMSLLRAMGHTVSERVRQGRAYVVVVNDRNQLLEAGIDRRLPDAGAGTHD